MSTPSSSPPVHLRRRALLAAVAAVVVNAAACASGSSPSSALTMQGPAPEPVGRASMTAPDPDPRVGLGAGWMDAEQASWNLRLVSTTAPPEGFVGITNSDLAFVGSDVIQGSYNGFQVWDVRNPGAPTLKKAYLCPASQSDVSVYENLLFISGEGLGGRVD